jgi:hypothetical protein
MKTDINRGSLLLKGSEHKREQWQVSANGQRVYIDEKGVD